MPNADWKKCADWVALPTTHTTASQPVTGKGSPSGSCSTRPTSCWSVARASPAGGPSSGGGCFGGIGGPPPLDSRGRRGGLVRQVVGKVHGPDPAGGGPVLRWPPPTASTSSTSRCSG